MSLRFSIKIFTEANDKIGYGHLIRSKIISEELQKLGHDVKLYLKGQNLLNKNNTSKIYKINNISDVNEEADCVLIDFYKINQKIINQLYKFYKCIMLLQDGPIIRYKNVSAIINYNIFKTKKYNDLKIFSGNKYVILRDDLKKKKNTKNYIFFCMGGSDPLNVSSKYLNLILNNSKKKVFVSTLEQNNTLKKFNKHKRVKVFVRPKNFNNLIAESDYAFSSCGTILHELASLRKKVICISLEKNQKYVGKYYNSYPNIKYLGFYKDLNNNKIASSIVKFEEKKTSLTTKSMKVNGSKILAKDISYWLKTKSKEILKRNFSAQDIINEYKPSFEKKFKHEKLHWGSNRSMNNRYNFLTKILNFKGVKNWIDLGSGDGSFQEIITKKYKNVKCHGIELSKNLIRTAKNKNLNNVEFYNLDIQSYKRNKKYDLITCHGVLSKTNINFKKFLEFSKKYLSKNGRVVFDLTNLNWDKFKKKNFHREQSHNWFDINDIKKDIKKNKNFKVSKIISFDPKENLVKTLNKTHCVFFILKKANV